MDQHRADKPLIVICGATGKQGGSVLRALAKTNKYRFRALTRDANSEKAKQLTNISPDIEIRQLNLLSHCDILSNVFKDAYGVFAMTDYWADPDVYEMEETQIGKELIDASVKENVDHVVWSTLPNVKKITNGELKVPHCTNKALVQQYAEELAQDPNLKTKFTYVQPGSYYQNHFQPGATIFSDNGIENRPMPLRKDRKIPLVDIVEDFGNIVREIFDDREKYAGKLVPAISSWATYPDILSAVANKLGREWRFKTVDQESFYSLAGHDLSDMLRFFNEYLEETPLDDDLKELFAKLDLKTPEKFVDKYGLDWLVQTPLHMPTEQEQTREVTQSTA